MEIKLPEYISTKAFYDSVLPDIERKLHFYQNEVVLLDFTETCEISALVIPNLVVLATYLRKRTGYIPYIRLGEDLKAGRIKKYLYGIKFFAVCANKYMYENNPYGGMCGTDMDPKNTTELFEYEDINNLMEEKEKRLSEIIEEYKRIIYFNIRPFVKDYLNIKEFVGYKEEDDRYEINENIILNFIYHMAENAFIHGESSSAVTIQANYKKSKIYLSIADSGKGFKQAWINGENKTNEEDIKDSYNVLGRLPKDEFEGIILGIYKRKYSGYHGLYNIVNKVMELDGTIRIHSNNTRIVINKKLEELFVNEGLKEQLKRMKTNYSLTSCFNGAHLEIELPITVRERNGSNVYYKRG